jgi:hypothetical protein
MQGLARLEGKDDSKCPTYHDVARKAIVSSLTSLEGGAEAAAGQQQKFATAAALQECLTPGPPNKAGR